MVWLVGVEARSRAYDTAHIVVFAVKFYLAVYGEVFNRSTSYFSEEAQTCF